MDNVEKSRRIIVLTYYGIYDEYQNDLIDIVDEGASKSIFRADLVAIEFSKEPDVFHILKYRGKSRSKIVTREQLNDMIDEMNKFYEDNTFTPREGVCGRFCDTHSSAKFVVYCELLARKKELLNAIAEVKEVINGEYDKVLVKRTPPKTTEHLHTAYNNYVELKHEVNHIEHQLKILEEKY